MCDEDTGGQWDGDTPVAFVCLICWVSSAPSLSLLACVQFGTTTGLIPPDEVTYEYLKGRPLAPTGAEWDKAVTYWKSLVSDEGAKYDTEVIIQAADIAPTVTWGTSPQVCPSMHQSLRVRQSIIIPRSIHLWHPLVPARAPTHQRTMHLGHRTWRRSRAMSRILPRRRTPCGALPWSARSITWACRRMKSCPRSRSTRFVIALLLSTASVSAHALSPLPPPPTPSVILSLSFVWYAWRNTHTHTRTHTGVCGVLHQRPY